MNVGAGILWTLMYVYLGEYLAALMPTIYSTCMGVILGMCVCRPVFAGWYGWGWLRGYDFFVTAQLALILLLPFAVHLALGDVEKSVVSCSGASFVLWEPLSLKILARDGGGLGYMFVSALCY